MHNEWQSYVDEMESQGLEVDLTELVALLKRLRPAELGVTDVTSDDELLHIAQRETLRLKRIMTTGMLD